MEKGLIIWEEKNLVVKTKKSKIERLKFREDVELGEPFEFSKKYIYYGLNTINYKKLLAKFITILLC